MAKIVKTLTISWQWSGDKYSLRGFNLAVTPAAKNPKEEVVATAFVETKEIKQTYSYKMGNVTLDKDAQYKIWVQAVYENSDSDWVATGGATVTDDGSATIITKTDREIQDIVNMASDNILTRQEKISLRREWQEIVYEFLEIESTAISQGIPSSNTAFSNFKSKGNALGAYLNGGTTWTISSNNKTSFPLWINDSNLGSNTSINGNTYRETFRVYYEAKVKILEEINKYKVNNVQVGGVNLLVETATAKNTNVNAPTGYVAWDPYTTHNKQTLEQLGFKVGDKVTVGFDWSISKNGTNDYVYGNFRVEFRGIKSDGTDNQYLGTIKNPADTFSSSNTKGRVEATVALDSTTIKAHSLRFRIDNSVLNFKVSNLKMERGTKATGWSPALEEMENAYTIILTNEAQVIPTNSNRVPTSSTTYFTDIQVYKGTTQRNDYTIGTINNANGITVSKTSSRVNFAVSANTALAADGGNFVIPITIDGKTFNKTFSWSCSKQGNTGASGVGISKITEYYAVSSSNTTEPTSWSTTVPAMTATNKYLWNYETITYSNNTTANTSKRVIGVYGDKGNTGATGATGNGISNIVNYYLATSSSSGVTTSTSGWTTTIQTVSASKKYLWNYEVITYTNNSTTTSTPCIIGTYGDKGDTGATGPQGSAGKDAYTVILTNESHTFPVENNGSIASDITVTTDVLSYKGASSITPTIGTLPTVNGLTLSKTNNRVTIVAKSGTALADSGSFNIPITVDGKSFTKTFSWAKSRKGNTGATGATGAGAKTADVIASSQVFKSTDGGLTFSPTTITMTPKLQNVTYSNWQYSTNGGSNWNGFSNSISGWSVSGGVLTINKDCSLFTPAVTSVVFRLNTNDSSVYDTMTIVKLYDVADLEIGGRNLISKNYVSKNNTSGSFNSSTNTWNLTATAGAGGTWGCGLVLTGNKILVPYGKTYVLSFEIKVPRTCSWNADVNNFPASGSYWNNNDNDETAKRKTSSKSLVANQWVKCWVLWSNTHSSNTNKVDLYDNTNFGIVMKDETSDMTFQIRNIKGELGMIPTDWTPAPEDVATDIDNAKNEAIDSANNTLTTTISNYYTKEQTNSQIDVAKEAINLGVSSTYETKANVETKITSTLNNAKSYADTKKNEAINTASSDATNKVNSAKNELNTAINKKANSSDVYSKAEVYTKGQTDSAIKVAKDEINIGVSNTYETKANVETKITSIQVGGTNLAYDTNKGATGWGWDIQTNNGKTISGQVIDGINVVKMVKDGTSGSGWNYVNYGRFKRNKITPATTYMASFEIKSNMSFNVGSINLMQGDSTNSLVKTNTAVQNKVTANSTSWNKIVFKLTTLDTLPSSTSQVIYITGIPATANAIHYIRNLKLEEGNKATTWSPAPEDITTDITTAKNEAISSAATDAANKANNAKNEAINSANATLTSTIANYYTKSQTDSQIKVAKDEINLGVSSKYETKANVETKVSSTLNSAKSYADTKKTEAINTASTDATDKVNSAKNELNTVINNIRVGGRNLYLKSDIDTFGTNNFLSNGSSVSVDSSRTYLGKKTLKIDMSTSNTGMVAKEWIKLKRNTTYTTSMMMFATNGITFTSGSPLHMWLSTNQNAGHLEIIEDYTKSISANTWTRVYTTFRTPNEADIYYLKPFVYTGFPVGTIVNICEMQVEEGNKYSSWSPAVEDTQLQIDAKANSVDVYTKTETYTKSETNSQIKVAKDEINLGVSNTYETKANVETKVSSTLNSAKSYSDTKKTEAINAAATDAANKVNSAKNELNTAIGKKANSADVYTKSETYTKTQTDSQINVAKNAITQSVSSTYETKTDSTTKYDTATAIAKAMNNGKIIHEDIAFRKGSNNVNTYNNAGNGNVKVERIAKPSDCPTTSTHCIRITTTGAASPNWGGFYQTIQSRANAVFIQKFVAKLPSGYQLHTASNPMGDGFTDKWLTSNKGTGKWETYIRQVTCGSTGTFSNGGHVHVSGATPTTSAPLVWYLASCTCIDITDTDERVTDLTSRVSKAEHKITDSAIIQTVSQTINQAKTEAINSANSNTANQLKNYSTTQQMNSAIQQKADSITSEIVKIENSMAIDNLLANGNFTNELNNWHYRDHGSSVNYTLTANTDWTMIGKTALLLTQSQHPQGYDSGFTQEIEVKPNTNYTFTGYIASHRAEGMAIVKDEAGNWLVFDKTDADYDQYTGGADISKWKRVRLVYYSGNRNKLQLHLALAKSNDNGHVWFHDFMVTEGDTDLCWKPSEKETRTKIAQLSDRITSTVSSIQTVDGKVNQAQSQIDQQAHQIASKVNSGDFSSLIQQNGHSVMASINNSRGSMGIGLDSSGMYGYNNGIATFRLTEGKFHAYNSWNGQHMGYFGTNGDDLRACLYGTNTFSVYSNDTALLFRARYSRDANYGNATLDMCGGINFIHKPGQDVGLNQILLGNDDRSNAYGYHNMSIRCWNSLGFQDNHGLTNMFFDVRRGRIIMKGGLYQNTHTPPSAYVLSNDLENPFYSGVSSEQMVNSILNLETTVKVDTDDDVTMMILPNDDDLAMTMIDNQQHVDIASIVAGLVETVKSLNNRVLELESKLSK